MQDVVAAERVVMLKTMRLGVGVVWVFRRTQWSALVNTNLNLSTAQMIEIDGAPCKIEAGFREIKQDIGSAHTKARKPDAFTNHLHFCMVTITLIYGASFEPAPARRYAAMCCIECLHRHMRGALTHDLVDVVFGIGRGDPGHGTRDPVISTVMDLVA